MRFFGIISIILFLFGVLSYALLGAVGFTFTLIHFVLAVLAFFLWFFCVGLKDLKSYFSRSAKEEPSRQASYTLTPVLFTGGGILLIAVINVLVYRYDRYFDLTEQQVHSLSVESQEVLKRIAGELKISAIIEKNTTKEQKLQKTLALIEREHPEKIKLQILDPAREPVLVSQLGMSGEEKVRIQYSTGEEQLETKLTRTREGDIIGAIRGLLRKQGKTFYFLLGHGESSYASQEKYGLSKITEALQARGIGVKPLLLTLQDKIPEDASGVAMIRAQKKLSDSEIDTILDYVKNDGGKFFLTSDPRLDAGAQELSSHFGITVGDDVILDTFQRAHESSKIGTQPLVNTYANHPILRGFTADMMTGFHLASSVSVREKQSGTPLLLSSRNAWAERNLELLFDTLPPAATKGEGDLYGPVPLAAAFEEGDARVVVFGDSDWLLNEHIDFLYNRDLALRVFDWLAGYDDSLSIPDRHLRASLAPISSSTFTILLAISFVAPELLILFGLLIWWRRRA